MQAQAKKYGFTGNRYGLSHQQTEAIKKLFLSSPPLAVVHGDCIGTDQAFHFLCEEQKIPVVIYPPKDPKLRAFCKSDYVMREDDYLKRNKKIVDFCDELIACPNTTREELRSGTWATIRNARKKGKIVHIFPRQ